MQEKNKTIIFQTIILWIVVVMGLFDMKDPFGLKAILLLLLWAFTGTKHTYKLSPIDSAVCLIGLYGIIRCFTGINPIQGTYSALDLTTYLLFYLSLRRLSKESSDGRPVLFMQGVCLFAALTLALSSASFFVFNRSITEAGFINTYHLRFLFRPLGCTTNAWAAVLIASFGILFISTRMINSKPWKVFLMILAGIGLFSLLLSFSRGAYIAMGVYLLLLFFGSKTGKSRIQLLCIVLIAGMTVVGFFPQETLTTLRMNETISQQKSTESRIHSTQAAVSLFAERPVFGYGTDSYTLAVDKALFQDSSASFTSYAPNLIVQWSIEKGSFGGLLYLLLGALLCCAWWRGRRNPIAFAAGCTLAALFIKELSLSTLSQTPPGILLCCILLCLIQPDMNKEKEKAVLRIPSRYSLIGFSGTYFVVAVLILLHTQNDKRNDTAIAYAADCNYTEAVATWEKNPKSVPYLINKAIACVNHYEQSRDTNYLHKAERALHKLQSKSKEDMYIDYLSVKHTYLKGDKEQAIETLRHLSDSYPNNALFHEKMYQWLYATGQKEEALSELKTAIQLYPSLLNQNEIKQLADTDTAFYQTLSSALLKEHPVPNASPSALARYGYIAYHYGDMISAEKYLTQALALLPNLSTPWYLLSEIYRGQGKDEKAEDCLKKHRLLTRGAFQPNGITENYAEERLPVEYELSKPYLYKFKSWYKTRCFIPPLR